MGSKARLATAIILLVILLGSAWLIFRPTSHTRAKVEFPKQDITYTVDIARSAGEKERGLAGREDLAPGTGMVFIYESATKARFWMKGMVIPIDIIWINEGEVVHIESNVLPPTQTNGALPLYTPSTEANLVLEITAGEVEKHGISVGDLTVFTE